MLLDKTLEQLDGQEWGEPTFQSSLVINCHRLRRVPLKDFTDGDLRRMIGQKFSLDYLVPLALMRLVDNPFEGEWFAGDLLAGLIKLPPDFWVKRPNLKQSLDVVAAKAQSLLSSEIDLADEVDSILVQRLESYEIYKKP